MEFGGTIPSSKTLDHPHSWESMGPQLFEVGHDRDHGVLVFVR